MPDATDYLFDHATVFAFEHVTGETRLPYASFLRTYRLVDAPHVKRAYEDAVPGKYAEAAAYARAAQPASRPATDTTSSRPQYDDRKDEETQDGMD